MESCHFPQCQPAKGKSTTESQKTIHYISICYRQTVPERYKRDIRYYIRHDNIARQLANGPFSRRPCLIYIFPREILLALPHLCPFFAVFTFLKFFRTITICAVRHVRACMHVKITCQWFLKQISKMKRV